MKEDSSLFKSFEYATSSYILCRIYANGEIVQKMCSMSTLMTEYAFHGRDFLAIHPGTHRTTPCILARDKAILMNLNAVRCIITSESMLIFNVFELRIVALCRSTIPSFRRFPETLQTIFALARSDLAEAFHSSSRPSRER